MEPESIEKILEIDSHVGCAMSGLTADSRTMIDHARVEAQVLVAFVSKDYRRCFLGGGLPSSMEW